MGEETSRREFLGRAAGAAGSLVLLRGPFAGYIIPRGRPPTSSSFPIGNRVVRIRVLNDDQSWTNAMNNYTPRDVLDWLEDLKPTTLNRYFSGPQNAGQLLPAPPGQKQMTVKEFLQASVNACRNPNNTTMFPRISYDYFTNYGLDSFISLAQEVFQLCNSLSPPQTLLSIDNYTTGNPDIMTLAQGLFNIGWKGLCWDACGAVGPEGYATFAMICVDGESGTINFPNMQALQAIGGYGEFEVQIDFPGSMSQFATNTPDAMADILTSLASGQAQGGYHFMYPIIQLQSAETTSTFQWDSTQIFTSLSGSYQGRSLYEVMKTLMQEFN